MTLRHQLDVLTLYDPDRSTATVNVWVARPTPAEAAAMGTVFVLTAIEGSGRVHQEMISLLQEELRSRYYQPTDSNPEVAFEKTIQHLNQELHRLILEGLGQWIDQANILIGVLVNQQLLMTTVGQLHAFMVRSERLHPLLDAELPLKPNPLRIFNHVIHGRVQTGDRLLFCTSSLLDYFSLEKLRRAMLDFQPNQAVRQIESTLLGVDPRIAFGVLIIELQTVAELVKPVKAAYARPVATGALPQVSMSELINREQKTAKLLSPSIWPAIRDVIQQTWLGLTNLLRRIILRRPPRRRFVPPPGAIQGERPRLDTGPSWIQKQSSSFRQQWQTWRARQQTRPGPIVEEREPVSTVMPARPAAASANWSFTAIFNRLVLWFQQLSRRQQFASLLVGVILLALSGLLARGSSAGTVRQSDVSTTVAAIERDLDQADAALLYGGDAVAQARVTDAQPLITGLPQRRKSDRLQKEQLQHRLEALQQRLARVTNVDHPKTILDLTTIEARLQSRQLYVVGHTALAIDPQLGLAVGVPLSDPTHARTMPNTLDTGRIQTGTVTGPKTALFVTERDGFVQLSVDQGTWKPLDARWPKSNPTVQFISFFQNKIYALDREHSSIVRFAVSANSLGLGSGWLKETADLSQARAAVVDGSVDVLGPNAVLTQYFSGRKNDFSLQAVTPPLRDVIRIWTDATAAHLYLLEPAGRRIVVFDKKGVLYQQYRSSGWTNLRDIVADEPGKTLYLLNGNTIESTPLVSP